MPTELISIPTDYIMSGLQLGFFVYVAFAGILVIGALAALRD
jgi:hypothetical protein